MKLAEVLSDLNTLRVCDHSAAIALVSARPTPPSQTKAPEAQVKQDREEDPDLQRAKDLLRLHNDVKIAHEHGSVDQGLVEARRMVKAALEDMDNPAGTSAELEKRLNRNDMVLLVVLLALLYVALIAHADMCAAA